MMCQPVFDCVEHVRGLVSEQGRLILLTPQGRKFDQAMAKELSGEKRLILIAGRYEGFDERIRIGLKPREISIGDYVLSGGELAAMVVIDAVARLQPGALGDEDSAAQDSFSAGLLDCPHFTRPETVDGMAVPAVLLGGNHADIERWRAKQALLRTWQRRPELLTQLQLSQEQQVLLEEVLREQNYSQDTQ